MKRLRSPLPREAYRRNAAVYRVMANPIRLEVLNVLKGRSASVEELTGLLRLRKANVSQHLGVLRQAGLVESWREGQSVFYRIVDPRIVAPCAILHELRTHRAVWHWQRSRAQAARGAA